MTERLFQATRGNVCAGFITRWDPKVHPAGGEVVHDSAPILNKTRNRRLFEVVYLLKHAGWTVREVQPQPQPKHTYVDPQ